MRDGNEKSKKNRHRFPKVLEGFVITVSLSISLELPSPSTHLAAMYSFSSRQVRSRFWYLMTRRESFLLFYELYQYPYVNIKGIKLMARSM